VLLVGVITSWHALISWYDHSYIITNKRTIILTGYLAPTITDISHQKIEQVGYAQARLPQIFLGYGDVLIYQDGSAVKLEQLASPRRIKDAIEGIATKAKADKKANPETIQVPAPSDPRIAEALREITKEDNVPDFPDADANYPPRPDGLRGPRKPFGPFRVLCNEQYRADEHTVLYIQRSIFTYYQKILVFALLLLLDTLIVFVPQVLPEITIPLYATSVLLVLCSIVAIVLIAIMFFIYLNYVDDVFIVTNYRIFSIQRFFFWFGTKETEFYAFVDPKDSNTRETGRDIKTEVRIQSFVHKIFDIGNIIISLDDTEPFILDHIAHPINVRFQLDALKSIRRKASEKKSGNKQKRDMYDWMSKLLYIQEQGKGAETTAFPATPNVQEYDYLSALKLAYDADLSLRVVGEQISYQWQPGTVVQQNPAPGMPIYAGGEIQVILSRAPAYVGQ
jgi:hypothetical protein